MSLFDVLPSVSVKEKIVTGPANWVVIDGNNLMNRCYYATAQNPRGLLRAPDGRYTNAVSLFLRMMINYEKSLNARAVVMFDVGKSYRKEIYPAYKEGRKDSPLELKEQFPLIQELLRDSNVPLYMNKEFEADDLIASFAEQVKEPVYIISNDRDVFQLITERVCVIVRKGKDDVFMTPELFKQDYEGLVPTQIIDLKSITGDSSDNIKGIAGIGDKGALSLLKEFGSIEAIIAVQEFPQALNRYKKHVDAGKEDAIFAKKLTTLHKDISLNMEHSPFNREKLYSSCESLGIKSLLTLLR